MIEQSDTKIIVSLKQTHVQVIIMSRSLAKQEGQTI